MKRTDQIKILASGFTDEEFRLYNFAALSRPCDALRYLSNRANDRLYRPAINGSRQKHTLEDKWVSYLYFKSLGIPIPETFGLFHPTFGVTTDGKPLVNAEEASYLIARSGIDWLVLKPRGGRQGRDIMVIGIEHGQSGVLAVTGDKKTPLVQFFRDLPFESFRHYDGSYQGWILQERVQQHSDIAAINPTSLNTIRLVTFINAQGVCEFHFAICRIGRSNSVVDNWAGGGLSVSVDLESGRLGKGVLKPKYGGGWTSVHPDSGLEFEGVQLPYWPHVLEVAEKAAKSLPAVRSIGWDIGVTESGPVVVEGNAEWDLPMVQIHTKGYLTPNNREKLSGLGVKFPEVLPSLPVAILRVAIHDWNRSRGPRVLKRMRTWWKG